jgi:formylglycine-generating enzyme required for sulfatase activity
MKKVKKVNEARPVVRGSCWKDRPKDCRSSLRDHDHPGGVVSSCGVRVVRGPRTSPVKKGDKGDGK